MAKKTAHKTKIYDLLKIIFTITSCIEVLKAKKNTKAKMTKIILLYDPPLIVSVSYVAFKLQSIIIFGFYITFCE